MTDYERDLARWKNDSYEQIMNGCSSKYPNPEDYDARGNHKGTKYTAKGNPIDPYLVSIYGRDYAEREADIHSF